jgi:hypothetical protein
MVNSLSLLVAEGWEGRGVKLGVMCFMVNALVSHQCHLTASPQQYQIL